MINKSSQGINFQYVMVMLVTAMVLILGVTLLISELVMHTVFTGGAILTAIGVVLTIAGHLIYRDANRARDEHDSSLAN